MKKKRTSITLNPELHARAIQMATEDLFDDFSSWLEQVIREEARRRAAKPKAEELQRYLGSAPSAPEVNEPAPGASPELLGQPSAAKAATGSESDYRNSGLPKPPKRRKAGP